MGCFNPDLALGVGGRATLWTKWGGFDCHSMDFAVSFQDRISIFMLFMIILESLDIKYFESLFRVFCRRRRPRPSQVVAERVPYSKSRSSGGTRNNMGWGEKGAKYISVGASCAPPSNPRCVYFWRRHRKCISNESEAGRASGLYPMVCPPPPPHATQKWQREQFLDLNSDLLHSPSAQSGDLSKSPARPPSAPNLDQRATGNGGGLVGGQRRRRHVSGWRGGSLERLSRGALTPPLRQAP